MAEWSSRQLIGDRAKRRLGRMRAYKRITKLEAEASRVQEVLEGSRVAKVLEAASRLQEVPEVRHLTDGDIGKLRRRHALH